MEISAYNIGNMFAARGSTRHGENGGEERDMFDTKVLRFQKYGLTNEEIVSVMNS